MRGAALVMLVTAGLLSQTISAAPPLNDPHLTIRIDDYVHLDRIAIGRAQRLVSEIYRDAGVRAAWAETLHPTGELECTGECDAADEDVTIVVLSASMGERKRMTKGALGFAAVGPGGGGRIAYVLYDRVAAAAIDADWNTADILALVIAHEVGHLLLPIGSHSVDGLMRAQWTIEELRRSSRHYLSFTPGQAELIRDMLGAGALLADAQ
jgi:hypothetical protein